jgi:branched-chain amino acid transport system ATP-binding protein
MTKQVAGMDNLAAPAVLETVALSKSFGGLKATNAVSLALHRNELHAVIGPNGAGKSTLVNLLAGEFAPSEGSILLDGFDVTALTNWRRTRAGIARSFQRTNIFLPLSVHENVRLAAQAQTSTIATLTRRTSVARDLMLTADSAIEKSGLTASRARVAGELSHGEQRQLEIAMTLATGPKVLLLDEPLAGMGQEEGERIATLLKSLSRDHAVLLIEHDMDFVFRVADVMTVLVEGAVLATGTPKSVRENAAVQAAYLGGHA